MFSSFRSLLVLAALLLLYSACSKKEPLAYYSIHDEMLSFVQLEPGDHYIYKDSATGMLDSVLVITSDLQRKKEYTISSGDTYLADYFQLVLNKVDASGNHSPWLDAEVYQPGWEVFLQTAPGSVGFGPVFWWPTSSFPYFEMIGSVTLEGINYQAVHAFYSPGGETCWWVKGIGIIKMRYLQSSTYKTYTLLRRG